MAQHIAHSEETRLVVLDNAAVGRDVYLAIGEGVEGINGLVARHSRRKVNLYLHLGSSIVIHFLCLNLALVDGFEDGVDKRGCGLGERNLAYDDSLGVELLYLCTHLNHSATLTVVVACHINRATRGEVGI